MNTKQLEYFIEVADAGSISKAARRLYLSQSSLTYQIQQLEKEAGCQLFTRTSHGTALTPSGEIICEAARECISILDSATSRARELEKSTHRTVTLGHCCIDSDPYFADFLAHAPAELPDTSIEPQVGNFQKNHALFMEGKLDLLVLLQREIEHEESRGINRIAGIGTAELYLESETCILRRDLLDPLPKAIYPNDLEGKAIILPDDRMPPSEANWFKQLQDVEVIQPKNLSLALTYAAAGQGIVVMPRSLTSLSDTLVQLPFGTGLSSPCVLIWHANGNHPHIEAVVQAMVAFYRKARVY